MRQLISYLYFFLTLFILNGCVQKNIVVKTKKPIDFQFVKVAVGDTYSSLAEKYNGSSSLAWRIQEFNNNQPLVPGEELIVPLVPFRPGGLKAGGYQLIPVLSYHNFSVGRSHNKLTISAKSFRRQLNYLRDNNYHVITIDQLNEFISLGQVPEKSVLITIDDGWLSSYTVAYPILKEFGFNATLFIPSQYIESGGDKAINWDQIKEMVSDKTIEIQCHGKAHRNLSMRGRSESFSQYFQAVEQDISTSKQTIYDKLGKQVTALAYPFGKTNPIIVEMLKKQGYKTAFTVKRKSNPFYREPFLLSRSMIYGTTKLSKFAKNLKYFETYLINHSEPIDTMASLANLSLVNPEEYENRKEWRTAQMAWKLRRDKLLFERKELALIEPTASRQLRTLKKGIENAQYKVSYITYKLKDLAKQDYLAATTMKNKEEVKKLLLQALLKNPDNKQVIGFFQHHVNKQAFISYQVKKSDSFISIAEDVYKASEKSLLIPLFNHQVKSEADLVAGMVLSLPSASSVNVKRPVAKSTKRCNVRLKKSAQRTAQDYYKRALENFDRDRISKAIKRLKTTICLDPGHNEAIEMLEMLQDI